MSKKATAPRLHTIKVGADAAYYGYEPEYTKPVTAETYKMVLLNALNWYAYICTPEDREQFLEVWIKHYRPHTAEQDLRNFAKLPRELWNSTIPQLARMQMKGFPLTEKDEEQIHNYVDSFPKAGKAVVASTEKKVSVQDRIRAQIAEVLGEIDEAADILTDGDELDVAAMQEALFDPQFKGPHHKLIAAHINRYLQEWIEVKGARANKDPDETDEQLVEAYAFLKARELNNCINTFGTLHSALSKNVAATKARKVRAKKPQDKRKVVSKLRYMAEFDGDVKLASIDRVDILGASELFVYDTKRRRLQRYVAETAGSLMVQGTKITGWNVEASTSKLLRKPEEKLPELLKLRKNQTAAWYGAIRSTEKPVNGRSTDYLIPIKAS